MGTKELPRNYEEGREVEEVARGRRGGARGHEDGAT
jgi:hypothetical protein